MATIRDIAKSAGVSIATVSRVINHQPGVSVKSRNAVLSAMEQMQYYPNSVARSLKTEATMSIGMIIQDLSNAHLASFCNSVENVVSESGYLPLIATTNNNPDTEARYIELMLSRRIDALVVHSCGKNNCLIAQVSQHIPVVAVYRRINHSQYHGDYVDHENQFSSYALTKHLLKNGHRNIFIINGPQDTSTGAERYFGFRSAMNEYGITVGENYPYRYDSDYTRQGGMNGCKHMLECSPRPTALIATNPETLLGALIYLRSQNVRIPEDISVVSCSDLPNAGLYPISITCAHQDPRMLGSKAGSLLLERIREPQENNREVIFPCVIEYGNSVRKL